MSRSIAIPQAGQPGMKHIVDAALIISTCLVLLKAVDLILLPNQQAFIQQYFEDLTLWFDDINIDGLAERTMERPIQIVLVTSGWFLSVAAFLILLIPFFRPHVREDYFLASALGFLFGLVLSLIMIISLWSCGY